MNPEWYRDWFNSEEYLLVYKHRDESEAELLKQLILKNIEQDSIKTVLDMACGAGRHAISFAKAGFKVTAIDLSERLLNAAAENAKRDNVQIDFHLSDIRTFHTVQKFDLVLNLFTSFGYFESDAENFKLLENAYKFLGKGGWFVLDYFNKSFILSNLIPITVEHIGQKMITQIREVKGDRVEKNINIRCNGKTSNFLESVRLYSKNDIITQLINIGFEISTILGDFYGNDFDEESSARLIIFSKK